ncbi:hypothetical protein K8I28_05615 [bacterium]|nr:hypothetical protein [bacterium]
MTIHEFAEEFLTFLEKREEKLISWGFHNIQYSSNDILRAFNTEASNEFQSKWKELERHGYSFNSLLRDMRQSNLLFRIPNTNDFYRTRMAEAIRLLVNLKQIFKAEDWATGPKLVSDLKLHLQNRLYPRRDQLASDVWNSVFENNCPQQSKIIIKDAYDKLTKDSNGNDYQFSGFQVRAFKHFFNTYGNGNPAGSVISAGTGSGKTKAFYLPIFLKVVNEVLNNPTPFTKVIAIYPRNVLLADQLREAISECLKLTSHFQSNGIRPISFGALLGSTPHQHWFSPKKSKQNEPSWFWNKTVGGHIIPYLSSPSDGKSELVWRERDRKNKSTALYRVGANIPDIPDNILFITREQIIENPPDILFLSLEMLNREMGNPKWRKAFGLMQASKSPRMVLLDEVHTYEGIAGAQTAWVLRRWKYWVHHRNKATSPHFVGLSATLKDSHRHMAGICGLNPDQISEFTPKITPTEESEMVAEGQEYNIVLKGDPASGTALLSTSIQTAMLLSRILTPRTTIPPFQSPPIIADKFYLKKIFGFTDNLDSLNRWYSNTRDAENKKLARLRDIPKPLPNQIVLQHIRDEGQLWELPKNIGHNLQKGMAVSRCSSQDPGANATSDMILATSSLEVGFDDPQVGMMIHHKAPSSLSSFIQRKGRAGRQRGSRPWTVVVLSDYGRDRWAFQSAERLFKPEIDNIHLPIFNPFVIRVQISLFLIDWLGHEIGIEESPYSYLSKPGFWHKTLHAQSRAREYLTSFLKLGSKWDSFFNSALKFYFYARGGLIWKSEEDQATARNELNEIFWEEPRPLLREAIPSLLRKLETNWEQLGPGAKDVEDCGLNRPIPHLIPKATFEELELNEARIILEPFNQISKDDEFLPVSQFLRECCPGRVSKRYSTIIQSNSPEPGLWHGHSGNLKNGKNHESLNELYSENIPLGLVNGMQVYRPLKAKLCHISNDIVESSSSEWDWKTVAITNSNSTGEILHLLHYKPWNRVFARVNAYLHSNGSWIDLIRYANKCRFEIRKKRNDSINGTMELHDDSGNSSAIGFKTSTDGLSFEINVNHLNQVQSIQQSKLGTLRYEYFLHKLNNSTVLQDHMNVFRIHWMAQLSISMLCATASLNRMSLQDAQNILKNKRSESAHKVLNTIFQLKGTSLTGKDEEAKLVKDLQSLWKDPIVVKEIESLESIFWRPLNGSNFNEWLKQRYIATIAQALRLTASLITEQVNVEDLVVDVVNDKGDYSILLTEHSSGGLGQIESVLREIKENPRHFSDALEFSIRNCPREVWSKNLNVTITKIKSEYNSGVKSLSTAFEEIRFADTIDSLENAKEMLISTLRLKGISPNRNNISAINMKLLRPGSSKVTDILTYLLNESWLRQNKKTGVEIPLRTFAYVVCVYPPSQRRLLKLFRQNFNETPTLQQLYSVIQQLLFEGCRDSCPDCLDNPNSLNDFGKPSRDVTLYWLDLEITEIKYSEKSSNWVKHARKVLVKEGRACIIFREDTQKVDYNKLIPIYFEELTMSTYRDSAYISSIDRVGGVTKVYLQIRNHADA